MTIGVDEKYSGYGYHETMMMFVNDHYCPNNVTHDIIYMNIY